VGIEPTHKGFADLSLTTWVPRLNPTSITKFLERCQRRGIGFVASMVIGSTRRAGKSRSHAWLGMRDLFKRGMRSIQRAHLLLSGFLDLGFAEKPG
jgi:hypothetical protein